MPQRMRSGLTLIELMVALAVLAILLVIAAPGIRDFVLMQRLKAIHAQLVTDLQFARSEAVASGTAVNLRVLPPLSSADVPCYIVYQHIGHDYALLGASDSCDCRQPPGNRCTAAGTRELRTVQVPRDRGVTFAVGQTKRSVAFSPRTGGMMLITSEGGAVTGADWQARVSVDTARTLSVVVGISGRPRSCKPASSTMSAPNCS